MQVVQEWRGQCVIWCWCHAFCDIALSRFIPLSVLAALSHFTWPNEGDWTSQLLDKCILNGPPLWENVWMHHVWRFANSQWRPADTGGLMELQHTSCHLLWSIIGRGFLICAVSSLLTDTGQCQPFPDSNIPLCHALEKLMSLTWSVFPRWVNGRKLSPFIHLVALSSNLHLVCLVCQGKRGHLHSNVGPVVNATTPVWIWIQTCLQNLLFTLVCSMASYKSVINSWQHMYIGRNRVQIPGRFLLAPATSVCVQVLFFSVSLSFGRSTSVWACQQLQAWRKMMGMLCISRECNSQFRANHVPLRRVENHTLAEKSCPRIHLKFFFSVCVCVRVCVS